MNREDVLLDVLLVVAYAAALIVLALDLFVWRP